MILIAPIKSTSNEHSGIVSQIHRVLNIPSTSRYMIHHALECINTMAKAEDTWLYQGQYFHIKAKARHKPMIAPGSLKDTIVVNCMDNGFGCRTTNLLVN